MLVNSNHGKFISWRFSFSEFWTGLITAECHRFKQETWQSHRVAFKEQFKNFVHADHDLFASRCARQHTAVNLDPNDLYQNYINSFVFLTGARNFQWFMPESKIIFACKRYDTPPDCCASRLTARRERVETRLKTGSLLTSPSRGLSPLLSIQANSNSLGWLKTIFDTHTQQFVHQSLCTLRLHSPNCHQSPKSGQIGQKVRHLSANFKCMYSPNKEFSPMSVR